MWKIMLTIFLFLFTAFLQAQTCKDSIPATTPDSRFSLHNDGTVTDNKTGLIWKRCLEGQSGNDCSTGSAQSYDWSGALRQAQNQTFVGYSDWRVPNIKELASIVEQKCVEPAINLTIFPNDASSSVWSASPFPGDSYVAWHISFAYGYDASNNKDDSVFVRLVRSRQ